MEPWKEQLIANISARDCSHRVKSAVKSYEPCWIISLNEWLNVLWNYKFVWLSPF